MALGQICMTMLCIYCLDMGEALKQTKAQEHFSLSYAAFLREGGVMCINKIGAVLATLVFLQ